jgi:hypothetical protein
MRFAGTIIALEFPAEYNFVVREGAIRRVSDTELDGVAHTTSGGWFGSGYAGWNDYSLHFVIQFDKPMADWSGNSCARSSRLRSSGPRGRPDGC